MIFRNYCIISFFIFSFGTLVLGQNSKSIVASGLELYSEKLEAIHGDIKNLNELEEITKRSDARATRLRLVRILHQEMLEEFELLNLFSQSQREEMYRIVYDHCLNVKKIQWAVSESKDAAHRAYFLNMHLKQMAIYWRKLEEKDIVGFSKFYREGKLREFEQYATNRLGYNWK